MINELFTHNNTNYHVRGMTLSDLPIIKTIRDQCLEYIHDNKSYDIRETINWFKMTKSKYLTVLENESIIGYFRLSNIKENSCHVGMDLHQHWRGKGIAIATYQLVMFELSKYGIEKFYLHVLSNNIHAIRLYTHIGFKEVNRTNINRNGVVIQDILMEI